jgi:hypothetical protein
MLDERRRRIMNGNASELISLAEQKACKFGIAQADRILQHGLKHRLQCARRTADHLQHLGGRRLPLQCFTQIVGALAQFITDECFR